MGSHAIMKTALSKLVRLQSTLDLSPLTAISAIDGRYGKQTSALRSSFSEYGLIHKRVEVEVKWLQAVAKEKNIQEVPELSSAAQNLSLIHI